MENKNKVGIVFGKFYPPHLGHQFLIKTALSKVNELHIFIGVDKIRDNRLFENSELKKKITRADRIILCSHAFLDNLDINPENKKLELHLLIEDGIDPYPNGWQQWADLVKNLFIQLNIKPNVIFTSEEKDIELHKKYFEIKVEAIDLNKSNYNINATKIRNNPDDYKDFMIKEALEFFYI
ncbi:MAG: adenylyltransferase/cytidyltransferase family protein [Psittacicella sp.]